jgi:hypothetical protein
LSVAAETRVASERYFAGLADAYGSAAAHSGELCFDVSIGPWPLRVSFASQELADTLLPPLRRLLAAGSGPALASIRGWDSASTGISIPSFPWSPTAVKARGAVAGYNDDRFRTVYRDDQFGFHSLSMFDAKQHVGLFWFAHHERIHWYERAEPFRAGIQWAMTTDRRYLAHASAVGDARGALLLTGKGGAGKTTTTLASIDAGLGFVGDNYVLISLDRDPVVYGLYGGAKLWPQTLEKLPTLTPLVRTFDVATDEKLVLDIARYRPERLLTELPVRAVIVTEVTGSKVAHLARCSPGETLLALAPTTILQLPAAESSLKGMAELVRRVPTYKLGLGQDIASGPHRLSQLLDELPFRS